MSKKCAKNCTESIYDTKEKTNDDVGGVDNICVIIKDGWCSAKRVKAVSK